MEGVESWSKERADAAACCNRTGVDENLESNVQRILLIALYSILYTVKSGSSGLHRIHYTERYSQHAHFIPIVGVGKRGVY